MNSAQLWAKRYEEGWWDWNNIPDGLVTYIMQLVRERERLLVDAHTVKTLLEKLHNEDLQAPLRNDIIKLLENGISLVEGIENNAIDWMNKDIQCLKNCMETANNPTTPDEDESQ